MTASDPQSQAQGWLSAFEKALSSNNIAAAVAMFESDCYWRDLVSFTWNITTAEGQASVTDLLNSTLSKVKPGHWLVDGQATHADGVTEAWFTFETGVGRGKGLVRLKGDKCWTLLTTLVELKGFEEKTGTHRIAGAEHGAHPGRVTWAEQRAHEAAHLGYDEQPEVVIIGGGQGGIALGGRG